MTSLRHRFRARALLVPAVLLLALGAAALATTLAPREDSPTRTIAARPARARIAVLPSDRAAAAPVLPPLRHHPTLVEPRPGVAVSVGGAGGATDAEKTVGDSEPEPKIHAPKAPSDAVIKRELAAFNAPAPSPTGSGEVPRYSGPRATVAANGKAEPPVGAPSVVVDIIAAGNKIASLPYQWGGGHGSFRDSGYDCSGSVSYALAGGRLLDSPLDSTGLESWGSRGAGRWVTVYANAGHTFMSVAGLRFDTSGAGPNRSRWQTDARPVGGYAVRHFAGL